MSILNDLSDLESLNFDRSVARSALDEPVAELLAALNAAAPVGVSVESGVVLFYPRSSAVRTVGGIVHGASDGRLGCDLLALAAELGVTVPPELTAT